MQFGGANLTFRGVLFQGRLLANDDTPAGSFINFDVNTQLSFCSPPEVRLIYVLLTDTCRHYVNFLDISNSQ